MEADCTWVWKTFKADSWVQEQVFEDGQLGVIGYGLMLMWPF
jgi:hypothetical protein